MKISNQQTVVIISAALLLFTTACATRPVDKHARNMAASCGACHGTNGNSAGGVPVLAGLDKTYFITQMQDMKSGKRPTTVMIKHAKGYSDEEIAKMAAYFAAQK